MKRLRFKIAFAVGAIGLIALCVAGTALAAYGVQEVRSGFFEEDGTATTAAGSHPFAQRTFFKFNTHIDPVLEKEMPEGNLKDLFVHQPLGFAGDIVGIPQCQISDFLRIVNNRPACPNDSAIGVSRSKAGFSVLVGSVFNLAPPPGAVAKIGFLAFNTPVAITVGVGKKSPYDVVAAVRNVPQTSALFESFLELWGVPSASVHDSLRGECLKLGAGSGEEFVSQGICESNAPEVPLLTVPSNCQGPLRTSYVTDSWQQPGPLSGGEPDLTSPAWVSGVATAPALSGCPQLGFGPTIEAKGTAAEGESPSGLEFDLKVDNPGLTDPDLRADSDIERASVSLPEGFTTNPSVANGLSACTLSQYEAEELEFNPAVGCPDSAKVGTVEVTSPLLEQHLQGQIYVAKQRANTFGSLLALYMIIRSEQLGILIKQPVKVEPDAKTGQLRTSVTEIPQLPFSDFHLHFREGQRAPLITPATCGTYEADADLVPYAEGVPAVHRTATLTVASGADGSGCASSASQLPNSPSISAGTLDAKAGSYSPFVLTLSRPDGSQQFSQIKTTLPEGLLGKLAGISYCPESGLAQAAARSDEGQGATELADPSCPASSEVGTVTVASGAGSEPLYVSGRAYLAGPYKGAPLSLEIITPAIAGPFDLGVVAVRTALEANLFTTEITAVSDPIPTILHGLPLDVRSVRVDLNRQGFTFNPTSCEPKSITGSATSTLGAIAPLSQYFQASDCQALQYKPRLRLHLKGATKRSGHPALRAEITIPKKGAYANTASIQVGLPHSEFLDQGNLDKVCTQPQLASASCPTGSVYGRVKVWTPIFDEPLEGSVYVGVGFGHRLPDLVTELNGQVRVLLHGRIDTTKHAGIRNTFEFVPDAPYSRVVLELKGGKKYGLLENSENLCGKVQQAAARFTAQSGKIDTFEPRIGNNCRKGSNRG
jgi:hypothetical protein